MIEMLLLFLIWNFIGFWICLLWGCVEANTAGWELCNPYWYHYYFDVNWFGAIILSLIYNLFCPFVAMIYWFYKLCTVKINKKEKSNEND